MSEPSRAAIGSERIALAPRRPGLVGRPQQEPITATRPTDAPQTAIRPHGETGRMALPRPRAAALAVNANNPRPSDIAPEAAPTDPARVPIGQTANIGQTVHQEETVNRGRTCRPVPQLVRYPPHGRNQRRAVSRRVFSRLELRGHRRWIRTQRRTGAYTSRRTRFHRFATEIAATPEPRRRYVRLRQALAGRSSRGSEKTSVSFAVVTG